jgi:hypothetical protein
MSRLHAAKRLAAQSAAGTPDTRTHTHTPPPRHPPAPPRTPRHTPTDTTDQDGPNGCEWLPVSQIEALLIEELGYEDQPEFEDALRGALSRCWAWCRGLRVQRRVYAVHVS